MRERSTPSRRIRQYASWSIVSAAWSATHPASIVTADTMIASRRRMEGDLNSRSRPGAVITGDRDRSAAETQYLPSGDTRRRSARRDHRVWESGRPHHHGAAWKYRPWAGHATRAAAAHRTPGDRPHG